MTGFWFGSNDTGTSPLIADTDGDGLLDGDENPDFGSLNGPPYISDPNTRDTDADGWSDQIEALAGSNPSSAASVPADLYTPSILPLTNSDFEDQDVATGETLDIQGWVTENVPRTVETSGHNGTSWNKTPGNASQVAMLFFRDGFPTPSMHQTILGTTTSNFENRKLTVQDAVDQSFTFAGRLGIQSFQNQWPTAHGLVRIGLKNSDAQQWQTFTTVYTGTEAQASTAGTTADVYLGLNDADPEGDSTVVTLPLKITTATGDRSEDLLLAADILQVNGGDQGRVTFDDLSLSPSENSQRCPTSTLSLIFNSKEAPSNSLLGDSATLIPIFFSGLPP